VQYWMYFIGCLFIFVVMFLPDGLAGVLGRVRMRMRSRKNPVAAAVQTDAGSVSESGIAK